VAEIFLYTPETQLNSMHLKALRKAGLVPIKVGRLDSVKQLARPVAVPNADIDLMAYAAFKTIQDYGQSAHAMFGKNIAELMARRTASAIEARSAETLKDGSVHESAVAESQTPNPSLRTITSQGGTSQ
jgi:hypothetical protein